MALGVPWEAYPMQSEIHALAYMAQHDPAVIAGLLLVGCSSALYFHVQLTMLRAGYIRPKDFLGGPQSGWDTSAKYLKACGNRAWSPWPVFLTVPCLLAGIGLLVFGLFRL